MSHVSKAGPAAGKEKSKPGASRSRTGAGREQRKPLGDRMENTVFENTLNLGDEWLA